MKQMLLMLILTLAMTGCGTVPKVPPSASDCGPVPVGYEDQIKNNIAASLIDPESARFEFEQPAPGWGPKKEQCWIVKIWVNAKNRFGGYTGRQPYWFYIRTGQIIGIAQPNMVPVADWGEPNPLVWTWH